MNVFLLALVVAEVLTSLQLALPASGEEVALLDLNAGNTFNIGARCDAPQIVVPITPKENLNASVAPQVLSVRFADQSDEALRNAFEVSWDTPTDVRGIRITVKDYDAIARAGTYDLSLGVRSTQQESELHLLKLQIKHETAKLRSLLDTLIIERTIYFFGRERITSIPLTLTEISNRSCLTDVRFQSLHNAAIGDRPVTGHLKFLFGKQPMSSSETSLKKLGAGGQIVINYKPVEDFPLGIAKGAVEVTAPELTDPLQLNFEVRSKLSRFYIFVFILLGLLASYLLKGKLQRVIILDEARLQAQNTVDSAEREVGRRQDQGFQDLIKREVEKLRDAIRGNDAAKIAKANEDLGNKLSTALKDLSTSKAELQKQVDEFLAITEGNWQVPAVIQEGRLQAHKKMGDIMSFLANDNVKDAQAAFVSFKRDLVTDLSLPIDKWQQSIKKYLSGIKNADRGISVSIKSSFGKAVDEKVSPAIDRISLDPQTTNASEIVKALQAAVVARRYNVDALDELKQDIDLDLESAKNLVTHSGLAGDTRAKLDAAISQVEASVDTFTKTLDSGADDPESAMHLLGKQLGAIDENWRKSLLGQESQQPVRDLFGQKRYVEALRQAIILLAAPKTTSVPSFGSPAAVPARIGQWQPSSRIDIPPVYTAFKTVVPDLGASSSIPPIQLPDQRLLWWAKLSQSVVIGLILILFGYSLYWDKFVGNLSDFWQIFFWAFGLDITVDTLKNLPRKT